MDKSKMSNQARADDIKKSLSAKLGKPLFDKIYKHWKSATKKKVDPGKVQFILLLLLLVTII